MTRSQPKYVQLAEVLRGQIAAGETGSRLPGLIDLSKTHKVSLTTVTKAEGILAQHGVITICQGEAPYTHPDKARDASLTGTVAVPQAGIDQLREMHRGLGDLLATFDQQRQPVA